VSTLLTQIDTGRWDSLRLHFQSHRYFTKIIIYFVFHKPHFYH